MAQETILQHWIFSNFIFPFLLIFFIFFAILEKTKILGSDKKQLNALVAFVIGLIFVSAVFPKLVVGNLILFLTVSIVIVFVILLLWGVATGGEPKIDNNAIKWVVGFLIVVVVAGAVLWATGLHDETINLLFKQDWSSNFWINFLFVIIIAIALALILKGSANKGG